jgi:hypothetical protein
MKAATVNPEVLLESSTIRDEGTHQAEFRESIYNYLISKQEIQGRMNMGVQ